MAESSVEITYCGSLLLFQVEDVSSCQIVNFTSKEFFPISSNNRDPADFPDSRKELSEISTPVAPDSNKRLRESAHQENSQLD